MKQRRGKAEAVEEKRDGRQHRLHSVLRGKQPGRKREPGSVQHSTTPRHGPLPCSVSQLIEQLFVPITSPSSSSSWGAGKVYASICGCRACITTWTSAVHRRCQLNDDVELQISGCCPAYTMRSSPSSGLSKAGQPSTAFCRPEDRGTAGWCLTSLVPKARSKNSIVTCTSKVEM
jgi:hypothetical protein